MSLINNSHTPGDNPRFISNKENELNHSISKITPILFKIILNLYVQEMIQQYKNSSESNSAFYENKSIIVIVQGDDGRILNIFHLYLENTNSPSSREKTFEQESKENDFNFYGHTEYTQPANNGFTGKGYTYQSSGSRYQKRTQAKTADYSCNFSAPKMSFDEAKAYFAENKGNSPNEGDATYGQHRAACEAMLGLDLSNGNVTTGDVNKAFRKNSLIHHPDRGGDLNTFQMFNEASKFLLLNPKKHGIKETAPQEKPIEVPATKKSHTSETFQPEGKKEKSDKPKNDLHFTVTPSPEKKPVAPQEEISLSDSILGPLFAGEEENVPLEKAETSTNSGAGYTLNEID